jgi:transcriptional regulator with XRE-family HTH domain
MPLVLSWPASVDLKHNSMGGASVTTRKDGKNFGQRLREARVGAGLSQSELEEISGIPKARLSRYENGHVAPSIQTLERLSSALNVSEASLLGDERAVLESFFAQLQSRGVEIGSPEQSVKMADALADMLLAAKAAQQRGARPDEAIPVAGMAVIGAFLDEN